MIVTVTMNPAMDKTIEIEQLERGGLHRIQKVEYDIGGKGINVSKTIRELGGESIATGFLGGNTGKTIENVLNQKQISNDFVWVEEETRTNTKVLEQNGMVTELNETGATISAEKMEELLKKLKGYANEKTLFVLAGSIPNGVDPNIYAKIISMVHEKGANVLLDADGEAFRQAIEAVPDMIKPNRIELEQYLQKNDPLSEEELWKGAKQFLQKGVELVVVSNGKEGASMICKDCHIRAKAIPVKAHSTVGAGDAMVAGIAYAWNHGYEKEEMMKLCMAVSAGAVMTIGTKPPTKEVVDRLLEQVALEKIGEETWKL